MDLADEGDGWDGGEDNDPSKRKAPVDRFDPDDQESEEEEEPAWLRKCGYSKRLSYLRKGACANPSCKGWYGNHPGQGWWNQRKGQRWPNVPRTPPKNPPFPPPPPLHFPKPPPFPPPPPANFPAIGDQPPPEPTNRRPLPLPRPLSIPIPYIPDARADALVLRPARPSSVGGSSNSWETPPAPIAITPSTPTDPQPTPGPQTPPLSAFGAYLGMSWNSQGPPIPVWNPKDLAKFAQEKIKSRGVKRKENLWFKKTKEEAALKRGKPLPVWTKERPGELAPAAGAGWKGPIPAAEPPAAVTARRRPTAAIQTEMWDADGHYVCTQGTAEENAQESETETASEPAGALDAESALPPVEETATLPALPPADQLGLPPALPPAMPPATPPAAEVPAEEHGTPTEVPPAEPATPTAAEPGLPPAEAREEETETICSCCMCCRIQFDGF